MAQITITLTIPDNKQAPVLDAFCDKYGYDATIGLTKLQVLKKQVIDMFKSPYCEVVQAAQSHPARVAAANDINSFDIT